MAWMRMMGAHSVAYHEANVANRADDHAGAALAYYGSRGETPLVWGGSGAKMLGLEGETTPDAYRALFAPGGARLPRTGAQLVSTRRPGVELVVSPSKSVAELGVIGRAEDMHAICDAERDATLAYLDAMVRRIGGRRGEAATLTPTGGLVWVTSRHATTRAGDPQVHDHVLIANVVWMRDERGGPKALDTAFARDQLHAATAIGRVAAARRAVELGYAIEADEGPSGRLDSWQIAGIAPEALAVHSKRSADIDAAVGPDASYRARNAAARDHREPKTHEPVDDLVRRWRAELTAAGYPPAELVAGIDDAGRRRGPVLDRADDEAVGRVVDCVLGPDGRLAEVKVFDRADVIVAVAPHLHGLPVGELHRVVDAVIADARCVPLLGVAGARTQAYATAGVLAAEARIAEMAEDLVAQPAARVDGVAARAAIRAAEERGGVGLNDGQRRAVETVLTSGAGLDLLVGVAGSGKTTALAAVRLGFETAGYEVIGTATSGQAARGLGDGAQIAESRTIASLTWRLDHDRLVLSDRHVICLDEAGMTDDPDLGRVLAAARRAGAKVIAAGDDRQLGAVGPGGGLAALLVRHPERVSRLTDNVRQHNPEERQALAELRAGSVNAAVDWYVANGRVRTAPTADQTIDQIVTAWADDVAAGVDALLLAWKRDDVAELNRRARDAYAAFGRLSGPEIEAPGGTRYAAGDRIVMLRPGPSGAWVTSERATITAVHSRDGVIDAITADGRRLHVPPHATGPESLALGYAVTAHRSQGATAETTHALEDGGGRELAYVAMSRARHTSHVYVTAPDLDEAAERLAWSWGAERRQHWALDQGTPQLAPVAAETTGREPSVPSAERTDADMAEAATALSSLVHDQRTLLSGTGRWATTPVGDAARALAAARDTQIRAQRSAEQPHLGRRQRRVAAELVRETGAALADAQARWEATIAPHVERLATALAAAHERMDALNEVYRERRWLQITGRGHDLRGPGTTAPSAWGVRQRNGPDVGL